MGGADTLMDYRSFSRGHWAVWLAILIVFSLGTQFAGFKTSFPYFLLISSLFGGYVFNFEFGRYSGYLQANYPAHLATMEKRLLFKAFPFFHVALWREILSYSLSPQPASARAVFRSSAILSGVGLIAPLALLPLYFQPHANVT